MAKLIDGAGLAKLQTLDTATQHLQRVNSIVEQMAQAVRIQQPAAPFRQQLVRAATPLVGLLKPQFDQISDLVTHLIVVSSRGSNDNMRVRTLREAVGQIRAQIEASAARVRQQHEVEKTDDDKGGDKPE
jgi:hypothetical protein